MSDRQNPGSFFGRKWLNVISLCLSDSLVLLGGLYLGSVIIHNLHGIPVSLHYALALIPVWWVGAVITHAAPAWGLGAVEELRRIQLLLLAIFALAGTAVFFFRSQFYSSRIVYLVSYLVSALFIPLLRIPVKKALQFFGQWGCPTVLYGSAAQVSAVIDAFQKNLQLGYIPCGLFTDERAAGEQLGGVPVLGPMTGHTSEASVAVVPVAFAEGADFDRTLSGYQRVVLLPDIKEDVFLWAVPRTLGTLIGLEITCNLLNPFARIFKRGVDLLLTLLTIPLWLPLVLILTLLIWLIDRQNPFFMQERIGKNNRVFRPVKFRTMVRNADQVLTQTLAADEALRKEWEQHCKLRNDPRVTRLGKILRRTSLDELPQLFNVLAGQMALVGPRPLPDYHHKQLAESARAPRARVRPGMTGLWQVSGRSESGTAGMEKWDTYYVRNWSFWLDITILARTFSCVIHSKGAY